MGFSAVARAILIVTLTILFFFLLPLMYIIFTPVYILRYLTSLLKRLIRPDLGNLVAAGSSIFACDSVWNKPKWIFGVVLKLDGYLGIDAVTERFRVRLCLGTETRCLYPELMQYPSTFLGFPVWVPEYNFNVEDHITYYKGKVDVDNTLITDDVIDTITHELTNRKFTLRRSPWMVYLMNCNDPGDGSNKCVLTLVLHHCLADGFSLIKLFNVLNSNCFEQVITPSTSQKRSFFVSILRFLALPVSVPFEFVKYYFLLSDHIGDWSVSKLNSDYGWATSSAFPVERVKEIRDRYKATTTGIIFTALSGAIRRTMLESGKSVPDLLTMMIPLPIPGHPKKLRNHLTAMKVPLPVGIKNARDRLNFIEQHMKSVKRSTTPQFIFLLQKSIGSLYPFMIRCFDKPVGVSMICSNFRGPPAGTEFMGLRLLEMGFGGPVINYGMGSTITGADGNIRVKFGVNTAVFQEATKFAQHCCEYLGEEFEWLWLDGDGI